MIGQTTFKRHVEFICREASATFVAGVLLLVQHIFGERMNDNNGGDAGLVTTVLLGAGFASMIIGPIAVFGFVIWRYGIAAVNLALAPLVTIVAIYRTDWLANVGNENLGLLAGNPLHDWLSLPWTTIAVVVWCAVIVSVLALLFNVMPSSFAGETGRSEQASLDS